jgi:hypothetical protein
VEGGIGNLDKIHIVIPFFDGWRQLKTCLDALRRSIYRDFSIIVVNHSGRDDFAELLPTQYPEVRQILAEPTLWWAGATNIGIRAALNDSAEMIMLLNHDCYVEPETIGKQMAHVEKVGMALIAPVPFDYFTKRVLAVTATTCFLLGFPTCEFPGKRKHLGKPMLLRSRLILGGRGVLIPSSVFEYQGLFDEVNFPSYYSDHDFYLRCHSRGISLFIAADTRIYVDDTMTSIAEKFDTMGFREFLQTLVDPHSHRNIRDLNAIFKFHYPIKGLHHIGLVLNLIRYSMLFGWKRLRRTLRGAAKPRIPARD